MWSPTHVQVTVQRARNLQSKGKKGTNDAFVVIQMGKEKFQTTIKEKSVDPEWYEECDLTLIGRDSDVKLTVYHRNVLGLDEFLGQTLISLVGIEKFDRPFTRWYTLKGKTEKSEEKNRGELEVKVAFIVQRCNDTQSLNDLSIRKKRNSLKNLAVNVGHKIQKLPSRSMSLRNLDPRNLQKSFVKYREKRSSISSDTSSLPEDDDEDSVDCLEDFSHISMRKHGSLYSSTLSLPQSAMITSSIKEDETLEEISQQTPEVKQSHIEVKPPRPEVKPPRPEVKPSRTEVKESHSEEPKTQVKIPNMPALSSRRNTLTIPEPKSPSHGEWTNRILAHIKESPIVRSETNLMEALKEPIVPTRKTKLENLRSNLRRHTLHLPEAPNLLALSTNEKKDKVDLLNLESSKPIPIPEGIPSEVIQQFERMNHKDLVLLAIKQQADLERQRDRIVDLENYLDNLLVRVMETTPRILQKPYVSPSCSSTIGTVEGTTHKNVNWTAVLYFILSYFKSVEK